MNNKLKELEEVLDKIIDAIDPEPLIKAEINYKPMMLGMKYGTNNKMVELFTKDYGITKQQIDDLIEKHLNQSLKNLTFELSEMIVKGIKSKNPDVMITKEIFEKKIVEDEQ